MNTDSIPDLHRGGKSKVLLKAETEQIIGFAFDVLNEVDHGLNEKIYENSLTEFAPDLIAFGSVVVDTKVIDRITDHERGQMLNYLRITELRVGLILNFKNARLEFERIVL